MRPLLLLAALPASLAALLTVSIPQNPIIADPNSLPSSTHAILEEHGIKLSAPITRANTFVFDNVTSGSWLLNVYCRDYIFESVRVDVTESVNGDGQSAAKIEAWQTYRGNEWSNKGEKRMGVSDGSIDIRPIMAKEYYQARSTFSVFSFLKSPMILMALFSLVMIVGVPYMIDNMDPESRAEFEEMQKSNPVTAATSAATNPASALQNFDLAGWMAGSPSSGSGTSDPQQEKESKGTRRGG